MPVIITITKTIIVSHLVQEMVTAGYTQFTYDPIANTFTVNNSSDTAGVTAVYTAHTGLPYPSELRQIAAMPAIAAITNWSTWQQSDWTTWYNANISLTQINALSVIPADVKALLIKQSAVIQGLAQVLLALRDYLFPKMPGGL